MSSSCDFQAMPCEIAVELLVDDFRGQQEGRLPQLGQPAFALVVPNFVGTLPSPLGQPFRRDVDHLNLIRPLDEPSRNRRRGNLARSQSRLLFQLLDVLNVDGREDRDAPVKKFQQILPSASVPASGEGCLRPTDRPLRPRACAQGVERHQSLLPGTKAGSRASWRSSARRSSERVSGSAAITKSSPRSQRRLAS